MMIVTVGIMANLFSGISKLYGVRSDIWVPELAAENTLATAFVHAGSGKPTTADVPDEPMTAPCDDGHLLAAGPDTPPPPLPPPIETPATAASGRTSTRISPRVVSFYI